LLKSFGIALTFLAAGVDAPKDGYLAVFSMRESLGLKK